MIVRTAVEERRVGLDTGPADGLRASLADCSGTSRHHIGNRPTGRPSSASGARQNRVCSAKTPEQHRELRFGRFDGIGVAVGVIPPRQGAERAAQFVRSEIHGKRCPEGLQIAKGHVLFRGEARQSTHAPARRAYASAARWGVGDRRTGSLFGPHWPVRTRAWRHCSANTGAVAKQKEAERGRRGHPRVDPACTGSCLAALKRAVQDVLERDSTAHG